MVQNSVTYFIDGPYDKISWRPTTCPPIPKSAGCDPRIDAYGMANPGGLLWKTVRIIAVREIMRIIFCENGVFSMDHFGAGVSGGPTME